MINFDVVKSVNDVFDFVSDEVIVRFQLVCDEVFTDRLFIISEQAVHRFPSMLLKFFVVHFMYREQDMIY